jgi:hypothetical protein
MIPEDLAIGLERTTCFGACPDYSLFIHGNGKIVYEGRQYVAAKGRHETRISQVHLRQIFDEFNRIGFFSLEERYEAVAGDSAVTKTSITAGGRKKTVINCHPSRAPESVYNLEKMIDEISKSARWIKDREGKPVLKP